ncbi:MAG: AMP-binding protein [Pseudomonadales bacterium]
MDVIDQARAKLGLTDTIDLSAWDNMAQMQSQACTRSPQAPAFTCMGQTLSYAELEQLSDQFAAYLYHHTPLQAGDRVALQLPNVLQYPVAFLGVLKAGMVVVNTNPLYSERELVHQFNDSGAKALIVLANVAGHTAKALPKTGIKHVIVTELGDLHSPVKRVLINFAARYIKKLVPEYHIPNITPFTRALAMGKGKTVPLSEAKRDDLMALVYTGGTTGVSKGAMISHANLMANVMQLQEVRHALQLGDGSEIGILPLPLYHIYASMLSAVSIYANDHTILIPNPRDIDGMVKVLKGVKMSTFAGLNTLFIGLTNNPGFRELDFSSLKLTMSGGMALSRDAADKWQKVTGCDIWEGYGLTETTGAVTCNPGQANQRGTIGLPVAGTQVRIVDEEGQVLGVDQPGELCARGPQVMLGYWQRAEATSEAIDNEGWFSTGDIAVVQPDGYIRIVDRKKDMVIVSGFNVYPNEVEDVLTDYAGVMEAAVIGIPNEKTGEAVKAFVVPAVDELSLTELESHCRENLAAYKVPRSFEVRTELPKSAVGKILRRELRDQN